MSRMPLSVLPMLALTACFDDGTDEVTYPSCDQTIVDAPWEEESALGFSPATAAEALMGPHAVLVANAAADENVELVEGSVGLYFDGTATFVDQEVAPAEGDGPQPAIGVVCDDYVALPAQLIVTSEVAGVDQSIYLDVQASDETTGTFYQELTLEEVAPLFEDIDVSEHDATRVGVSGTIDGSGAHGSIDLMGEGSDGDTAWSMIVASVTWEPVDGE